MSTLIAYLNQLAPIRSRRNRNRGAVAVDFHFPVLASALCLAISVNWLPCVAVETEIEGAVAVNGLLPTGFLCSRRSRSVFCRGENGLHGG